MHCSLIARHAPLNANPDGCAMDVASLVFDVIVKVNYRSNVSRMSGVRKLLVDRTPSAVLRLLDQRLSHHVLIAAPMLSGTDPAKCGVSRRGVFMSGDELHRRLNLMDATKRIQFCDSLHRWILREDADQVLPSELEGAVGSAMFQQPLFVKDSLEWTSEELQRRALRLLGLKCGRSIGEAGMEAVEQRVERMLSAHQSSLECFELAVYHGIILFLCESDPALAEAIAVNGSLPALNATVATALARMPEAAGGDLSSLEAMASRFAAKDELVPSSNTVATALALRARKLHWDVTLPPSERSAADRCMRSLATEYRVDPSVAFASNIMAIQQWSMHQARVQTEGAAEDAVLHKLIALRASLKSTTANAVSTICMSDIERPWVESVVTMKLDSLNTWRSTLPTILQDPKRWLVDARLLKTYAQLLDEDHLKCNDPSFAAFVDECGECYLGEQPDCLRFTFQRVSEGDDTMPREAARAALLALAPASSFWMTLMQKMFDERVVISKTADGHAWRAVVTLPASHESIQHSGLAAVPQVLFEDASFVAFNKPAGLPVSRHALCCTQRGGEAMTDLSSVLLKCPRAMFKPGSGVFRGGQLHRLDIDTSGVIIYAKTEHAMRSLRHQIGTSAEFGAYPKCYTALCRVLERDLKAIRMSGSIQDSHDPRIKTRYSVLTFFKRSRVAFVECRIQQGKKHQIRRHLASIGMPILQDVEYGGAACTTPLIDRIALHASGITFVHPKRRRPVHIAASLPADMDSALKTLQGSQA